MRLRLPVILLLLLAALIVPGRAAACSHDDTAYYETFLDTSCLQLPLAGTTLDALGGLRLTTNGAPVTTAWDTDTDFVTGVNFQSLLFPPLGVSTLAVSGTGSPAALNLPATPLPLSPDAANPVLSPAAASVLDNDNVDDAALAKVGTTYYMWYSGTSENGGRSALFLATSSNGTTWTRGNGGNPVLQGTPASFDQDGVFGADVIYDPANASAPFRTWYSGRAGSFGSIGYATSTDGVNWTKYPSPVLSHGQPGSADSFGAADPTVLVDGSALKMWYTGDDSSKKRIAYATSTDGVIWAKGGKVIAPEDAGVSANLQFGAFAPTVWKTAAGYSMLLTGRKLVGGGVFQTKILSSSSTDGISWTGPSPAINPSGSNTNFDYSNLNSPELLQDPGTASPFKVYYSGNTIDNNGNFHTRIGLATSNDGNSFAKFNGAQPGGSVLDIGALGSAFDGRQTSGVSAAAPAGATPKLAGFYWGTRGSDFKPRLGEASSADGTSWTKVPVSTPNGGALFGLGNPASFDNGGERDPGVLYDSGSYDLYFTGLDSGGTASIGFASAAEDASTKQPDNATWSARSQLLAKGSSGAFDSAGVSHPAPVKDGAGSYLLYYGGTNGTLWKIGLATAGAPGGAFTKTGAAVLDVGATGSFDEKGVKDPVVTKVGTGDYRMLYTGVDAAGIERVGYATSADGTSWTKQGIVLDPSLRAFADDQTGVEPTGLLVDGSTLHVWTSGIDATGRTRGDHATSAFPPTAGRIPNGWATYQLGNASTGVRDFRRLDRTSTGGVSLWMSFLQPYSSGGNEFWSDYFPVTASSPSEILNFLLTVHGVRWQARLSSPASSPSLDKVQLTHAPVSFTSAGSAVSAPITAAQGRIVTAWTSLVVNTSLFSPGGGGTGSAAVRVLDAGTGAQLLSAPLTTGGDTAVDLSTVPAASSQALRVELDLASADGQATPRVNSFKVLYATATAPPPPPLPIALTLAASPLRVVFGKRITLSGTLTQGAAALGGQSVALFAKGAGNPAYTPLPPATTDTAGAFTSFVKPSKNTTYKASFTGAASEPTVAVSVAYRVTLRAVRKGSKRLFRGKVAPARRRGPLVLQVKTRSGWKRFAKVKLSKKSTFAITRKLAAHKKYRFRATTPKDARHAAGVSRVVSVKT